MAKLPTKQIERRKTKRWLRCNLTNEEKLAAGKLQADKAIELISLENDAKRVAADFKAKVAAVEAELQVLANKISSGYEHRNVSCTVEIGSPDPDKKRIIRDDTFEEVAIEDLSEAEKQRDLITEEN